MKLKSTQLFNNIKEFQHRFSERKLEKRICKEFLDNGLNNVDAIYLTHKVLNIIRFYKF
mgnify:CR=1 FL=1